MKQLLSILLYTLFLSCQQRSNTARAPLIAEDTVQKSTVVEDLLFSNDTISVYKIDSISFFKASGKLLPKTDTLPYIKDFERAKIILTGRAVFGNVGFNHGVMEVDTLTHGDNLCLIRASNGHTVSVWDNTEFAYIGFYRYYPTEEILLFEGGHSSDFAIDLRTGIVGAEQVGNPAYILYTPNKQFRLNGYFPGQECSAYFIQRMEGDHYVHFGEIPLHLTSEGFDLCTLENIFWNGETELYFRNTYFAAGDDKRLGFFKLKIHSR
ncbi:hypothetical protein [Sphingobacterium faecale]|uniref:Lipoprotein n=1 Tax=Sphingobacterium faecale TaxID=2803775 RepID=A0ABS1R3E4_9SPHI|nr:hypothetical protein [Sphingobacterium faecale]MBL1409227.1 hypothetical protein [Sphingobacterium faecale]